PAERAPQRGSALEPPEFLVPCADRAGGEVVPADLAEPETRRPDRRLQGGDPEEDHLVPPGMEPPAHGRQPGGGARRQAAQDAGATHGSVLLPPAALGRASDRSQPWQRAAVVYPAGKCCRTKAEVSIGCDYTRGAVTAAPAATRGATRVRTRARA